MTIRHHLADDLLLGYAAGSLAEGWSLAVATHLALCPECRRRLATSEAVGGAMLESLAPAPLDDEVWREARRRIAAPRPRPAKPFEGRTRGMAGGLPEPLRSHVGGDVETLRWRALGRGAYQIHVPTSDSETRARLLRIPAGKPVPEHSHGGRELTLVLAGSFFDGAAQFGPGDIEDADSSIMHQPVASPDQDCICLAVTDAPLRFRSWIVRAVQPLLDI